MRIRRKPTFGKPQERGVALLLVIAAIVLLASLSVAMVFMARTDIDVNNNYRDSQAAYFAARAGIEEARQRLARDLNNDTAWDIAGPTAAPTGAGGNLIYITNPSAAGENINPFANGTPVADLQLCWERFDSLGLAVPGEAGVPCAAPPTAGTPTYIQSINPGVGTGRTLPYKWVRINTKKNRSSQPYCPDITCADTSDTVICWDGSMQRKLPAGQTVCEKLPDNVNPSMLTTVWRVTSLAVTPGGGNSRGSRRMLQAEVANTPPFAVNASVQSKDHVTLHGNLVVNAMDHCSCECQFDSKGVVLKNPDGTLQCVSRPGTVCDTSRWAIYSADQVTSKGTQLISSAKNPPFAEYAPWDVNVDSLVQKLRGLPETVDVTKAPYGYACTGTPPNCGTQNAQVFGIPPQLPPSPVNAPVGNPSWGTPLQQITYVPGDLKLTAQSIGNGILVVDGNLEINGGLEFYGLILVNGTVEFSGGGSATTNIYGAVLAATKSIDSITNSMGTELGGSFSITYDYCALKRHLTETPPEMLTLRELAF